MAIDTSALAYALAELRRSRKYAWTADTDAEQALTNLAESQCDLLEALAEVVVDIAQEVGHG